MKKPKCKEDLEIYRKPIVEFVEKARKIPSVHTFFWLLRCSDAVDKYAGMAVRRGEDDNRTGLAVLQVLLTYQDGVSQKVIAEKTGRSKQAIVLAIDNLVKKGYVVRCPADNDRRINLIKLTQIGLEHLSDVFPRTIEMCNDALSCLDDSEMDQLRGFIVKLTKHLLDKIDKF